MEIKKSTRKYKKYMLIYKGKTIHFGDSRYSQYRDSTPLKLYKKKDHFDKKRRERYFLRHSGVKTYKKNKKKIKKKKFFKKKVKKSITY
jgi:hypothetical protein